MPSFNKRPPHPLMRPPIIGAAFGIILVLGSIIIGSQSLLAVFSLEGLLIVVGGVIAVAFMSYESEDVHKALDAIKTMYKEPQGPTEDLHQDMMNIVSWSRLVTEKGLRTLETSIGKDSIADPFVKYGLNMVVSGYAADEVRAMMETAADAAYERASAPVDVLEAMTSHAPAFGMVGTLVGMVTMLCRLNSDDMAAIGSSLAVAFLSTLYGVVSARMIYMPAAAKLKQEVDAHRARNQLIIEGLVMMVGGKTPMYIQDHLNSFLRPEKHDYYNIFVKRTAHPRLKVVNA